MTATSFAADRPRLGPAIDLLFGPARKLIALIGFARHCVLVCSLFLLTQLLAFEVWTRPVAGIEAPAIIERLAAHDFLAALLVCSTALAAYLLVGIRLADRTSLERFQKAVDRIASGDLSAQASVSRTRDASDSDTGHLQAAVGQMNENLLDIVNQVRSSAETIANGARRTAEETGDLARRTDEQAATLEETASSMEELAATAEQNAQNCRRANEYAEEMNRITSEAVDQMRELTLTMKNIDESSQHVTGIVGVIEEIAFQTNILALNAAVEAAHAGDQGRGFAAVAAEVRSLAQRSAVAANEIKALVGTSVGNAARGMQLADDSGGTIEKVCGSVQQVRDLIGAIASASGEQSEGIQQINNSIVQLDAVTQQNAAMVQRVTAAAAAFRNEAARLIEVVGAFKTDRMDDREQAVALVKKAVAQVLKEGSSQACRDFEDPGGEFIFGDFYVYAIDFNGIRQASGADPSSTGEDILDLKDADGRPCIRDIIHIVRTRGKGWYDYKWLHPHTRTVEMKSVYFEAVDGMIIICGIYKGDRAAADENGRRTRPGGAR